MATNGETKAPSSGSLVDASGYKFAEKDTKPGKIRLKKSVKLGKKKGDDAPDSPGSSPILPEIDEKTMAAFPTGKPREEDHLETVICKTCKRPVLKQNAVEHIRGCIRAKQEKARRKKEARDAANRAKAGDKDGDEDAAGGDGDDSMKGQKSAKKSAVKGMAEDGTKKGKKRKTEGEDDKDKEPKKKKKKEEPKPKVPKPKGPVDVEKQCGVTLPNGAQCARSLTCKSHSMGAKRAVPGRSLPYDMLLQAYQKKNQARQQKAAIDANAPLQDDMDNNGPVDSDEEKDAVMAAITRSHPQPIITHTLISTKKKYQYVRIKEMLSHALGGARGGGLFSTGDSNTTSNDGNLFAPVDDVVMASPAEPELADQFRREVATLLGRNNLNFPGAQPVSFSNKHLLELQRQDYYVCEKTDGIRCLMYFARGDPDSEAPEIHYLIDRKNDYRYVPGLHFPLPNDESFQSYHVDTLVDGELVNDTYEDGTQQLKYLVFDCLVLDGQSLMHRTLDKRLAYFKEKVLKPYNALYQRFPEEKQHRVFAVEDKSTQFSYGIEMMFREIIPKVKKIHGNDGLIFTCRSTPYRIGTDEHILKWKPPAENTIDFRMRLEFPVLEPDTDDEAEGISEPYTDYDAMPIFHLFVMLNSNEYRHFAEMFVTPSEWEELKALGLPLDDTIVECSKDEHNRWRYHRLRDDKADANHISTVEKVLESIQDRVTEEDLIRAAPAIKAAWKKRQAQMASEDEERKRRARQAPPHANGNGVKRKFEDS
ncbi:mRNA capping enzyme, catalytic domain-containing protein [Aspergillus flavus]|uniref:mRNA-capping enzyme subunit alpha n=1 Tax=Aspergillus flavus (strain ATCC 200026 / FGSC A1120 / IAM 13836 / NRRL 3357 / JCM 12722 / SRRC 167) TaxID=332952 RepID=A0A7U2MDQ2_ASPFN|nr:mRNA capping enzyme, catalytic domain-containing protein [Aspergillus flavus]